MSKVVVYILDRLVWMLLITALTTQALQIAGILESPNNLPEISYSEGKEYSFEVGVSDNTEPRGKRETAERSKIIDTLFNIPIQTLNAVNNLVQNSRPALKSLRDYAIRKFLQGRMTTTTTENPESNLHKRSYPVYIRPKNEIERYRV